MEGVDASREAYSQVALPDKQVQDSLSGYSPKDAVWDLHKGQADDVGMIYAAVVEFEKYAQRMAECGDFLRFAWKDLPTGESVLRLRQTNFCRVRHCPVCQWRRSLMWQARFFQSIPKLQEEHPKARWLFLTLTIRNCSVDELGATLTALNEGWQRLIKRKEFKPVTGWVRTTEVTRGEDGSAHPHFHALLMVPSSMLSGRHYVKQSRWVALWGDCMRLDYLPSVNVKAVKDSSSKAPQSPSETSLHRAVVETLKYSIKPADMTSNKEWFLEVTRQIHKRRFVATGGALKDFLKLEQEDNADLVMADGAAQEDAQEGSSLAFNWRESERKYRRAPNGDK